MALRSGRCHGVATFEKLLMIRYYNRRIVMNSIHVRDFRTLPGSLVDPFTWVFPTVKSVSVHGNDTEWIISVQVHNENGPVPILDEYFDNKPMDPTLFAQIKVDSRVGDGPIKKAVPTIVTEGKNKGRKNETNVFCQALRDALGTYNKQLRRASKHIGADVGVQLYPPMLAQVFKDQKNLPAISAENPVFVQRKYNGVRTVATLINNDPPQVIMYSRRRLLYPGFQYIKKELEPILVAEWGKGIKLYLDGEIYMHGAILQDISGYARRESRPGDPQYDYMIYDCFIPDKPDMKYSERYEYLCGIIGGLRGRSNLVETFKVDSREEIEALYDVFIEEGYEGAMVRQDHPYKFSYNEHHSKSLLKMKPTYDAEFLVIGYTVGMKGKALGALMIICQTQGGIPFPCTPAMEIPARIALAKKMAEVEPNGATYFDNHWRGKYIIVYYDEMSRDQVPQRARTRLEQRVD